MYQRARVMAGRRVHDHSGGLVDDGEIVILVHNLQRYVLGGRVADIGLGYLELHHVAHGDAVRRIGGVAVDAHEVALDEARRCRAAEVLSVLGEKAIQPRRG
jgi:hypothetical protein